MINEMKIFVDLIYFGFLVCFCFFWFLVEESLIVFFMGYFMDWIVL